MGARADARAGVVRINSGNLRNPRARENEWIIDETVYVVHEVAAGLVRTDAALRGVPRPCSRTPSGCSAYLDWRDRVFLAPRPLDYYLDALRARGFSVDDVTERTIEAGVEDWFEFLVRLRRRGARLGRRLGEGRRRRPRPRRRPPTASSCCDARWT